MSKFGQSIKFFEDDVTKKHAETVRGIEDYVYNQLRAKSPVLSGAYRSNHNRTLGAPDYTFSKDKTSSEEPQPTPEGSFFNMYISNGAPYAAAIEEGNSDKAPDGVYGLALQSAKAKYGL